MADSKLTKCAFASAMKELMAEMPFEKINVTMISERCGMSRKSFYYHFKDKYDLINWIYDTEFNSVVMDRPLDTFWNYLSELFDYFYANRGFYNRALHIKGQNSFSEYFRELLSPIIERRLKKVLIGQKVCDFHINFLVDGVVCAIERWLKDKDCMPPDEFLEILRSLVQRIAEDISSENSDKTAKG